MPKLSYNAVIVLGSLCRLGMLLDIAGPAILPKFTHTAAIQSILYDPKFTLEHLKELHFISKYFDAKEKTGSSSLFFIIMTKIISKVPSGLNHELVFCMIAMLLDLAIASQLYRLTKEYCETKTDHNKWEMFMEKNMNPLIYPITKYKTQLFGSRFDDISKDFSPLFAASNIPTLSAMVYYLNPITILTSSGPNVQGIQTLLLVSALTEAVKGNATLSGIFIAVVCHIDIVNIVFVIPSAFLWKSFYEFQSRNLKEKRPSPMSKLN
jgi:hypothetical protein